MTFTTLFIIAFLSLTLNVIKNKWMENNSNRFGYQIVIFLLKIIQFIIQNKNIFQKLIFYMAGCVLLCSASYTLITINEIDYWYCNRNTHFESHSYGGVKATAVFINKLKKVIKFAVFVIKLCLKSYYIANCMKNCKI